MVIIGTLGNDILSGTSKADKFKLNQGGDDVAKGKGGDDSFTLGKKFSAADHIDGGAGFDTLSLKGNYSKGITFGKATLKNVEKIDLADKFSYKLTTHDKTVAAGQTLTVDAHALGATKILTFNGAKETDGHFTILGGAGNDSIVTGAGNDTVTGNGGNDLIDLHFGGNDAASGGTGNDTFLLGGTFTAADSIDGGADADTVSLDGDYSAGLALGATTLTGIEHLNLAGGHGYNLTTSDATIAASENLVVDGSALGAGNALTFDASAETDGTVTVTGGAGNDVFTGGTGNDTFVGGSGGNSFFLQNGGNDAATGGAGNDTFNLGNALTAADTINGGGGSDTVTLSGTYAGLTFAAPTMMGIETIVLAAGSNYTFTTVDGNVAAAGVLTVNAAALGGGNGITFTGTAELDGSFAFIGGAGSDTLFGGAQADTFDLTHGGNDGVNGSGGNDTFSLGATLNNNDAINGGSGSDTVTLAGSYSLILGATTLASIETITLAAGSSYNLTTDSATVAGAETLTVDGSGLGAADTLTFNGSAEGTGSFIVMGGAGADSIRGGGGNDTITGGLGANAFELSDGGNDTATGGNGDESFVLGQNLTAADTIDGGGGADYIEIVGNTYSGLVLGANTLTNIETIIVNSGFDYSLTTNNNTVASAQTLTVNALSLSAAHHLTFNGSAEADGHFFFKSGQGSDTLTGGALSDTFSYAGVTLSGATRDTIHDLNWENDKIKFHTVVDTTFGSGALNAATFDADLTAATASGQPSELEAGFAMFFEGAGGDLNGKFFVIVDGNDTAGYQAGSDLVIELTAPSGNFDISDFIA